MEKGGVITEEKVIARAQYLDLIYSQSGMLYDKIPDAPRLEFFVPPPPKSNNDSHAGDGVIGTIDMTSTKATSKKARKISNQNENDELLAEEVNVVSTDKGKETKKPGGKKKNKREEEEIGGIIT